MEFAKFHLSSSLAGSRAGLRAGLRPVSELDSVMEFGLNLAQRIVDNIIWFCSKFHSLSSSEKILKIR